MNRAQLTSVKRDLRGIAHARTVLRRTIIKMKQSLGVAFVYDAIGVPLAAGVLYPLTGWLVSLMGTALAVSLSFKSVISNALPLRTSA